MSNLKERLQHIKDDYAKEKGYDSYQNMISAIHFAEDMIEHEDEISKRYAEEVIKEASEAAKVKFVDKVGTTEHVKFKVIVDKQSILKLIEEL